MLQLIREICKPIKNYLCNNDFRDWMKVKSRCRTKTFGKSITLKIAGFKISGHDAQSFLHQYKEIFVNRSFEVNFLKNDPLIYCCGANIGLEVFFFKKQFPNCKIKAYEADPNIAEVLATNVAANMLKNVETVSAAVWTANGNLKFQSDGSLGGKIGSGTTSVKAVRLSDELSKESNIDLLVMDIEGSELAVLTDCKNQLHKVEKLFVEWHGAVNTTQNLDEILVLLKDAGFRYQLNNKLPNAPFVNGIIENGFDSMVEIYASRS